jgi:hypothetical protein
MITREQIAKRLNIDEQAPWRILLLDRVEALIREAVEAERWACYEISEEYWGHGSRTADNICMKIKARGETK